LEIVKNLGVIVRNLFQKEIKTEEEKNEIERMYENIKDLWNLYKSASWRPCCEFIKQIPNLYETFNRYTSFLDFYTEEMCILVQSGNLQVKYAAGETLSQLLLYPQKKREEIYARIQSLTKCESCNERIGLIEFTKSAVNNFSQNMLKDMGIINSLCELGKDKTLSVKIKLLRETVGIMKKLNESKQAELYKIVELLAEDPIKTVKNEALRTLKEIDVQILKENTQIQSIIQQNDETHENEEFEFRLIVFLIICDNKGKTNERGRKNAIG